MNEKLIHGKDEPFAPEIICLITDLNISFQENYNHETKNKIKFSEFCINTNFYPRESNSKILVNTSFIYKCSMWRIMGFKTNDNHIENLIMDFYNEKLLEFNFLQISKYEYINFINIRHSEISFASLNEILLFKNIKRLVLEEIKIIEKNENVRFTYRNNSIMILEVIYPEISSKSIIYDYIDMLDELKNLRLQFENKLAKNYILSHISKYDILELSFLTESKSVTLEKVNIIGSIVNSFQNCKFNQIESLTFKYCIFSTSDKESIRCKNLEYIKFHRCKFNNINFSNLFCKDIRYKIKSFI
ncbi:hypothetical protein CWI36_0418p0010 [Hamiltosporidium magnivora]|uniref:Uncharacterized protein n=1 Tax=Hamiltosporidium magnivora TaxID=148818 RepID=A0A4Q9LFZ3_9MICR|nr:hypothetical protein CWI36_0474p0030 [Hamiltosporidium magnivora]TBU06586.1 hypothetical protein CWI36_0418p0010 [Hamiltosporidium magnivora]